MREKEREMSEDGGSTTSRRRKEPAGREGEHGREREREREEGRSSKHHKRSGHDAEYEGRRDKAAGQVACSDAGSEHTFVVLRRVLSLCLHPTAREQEIYERSARAYDQKAPGFINVLLQVEFSPTDENRITSRR